MEEYTYEELSKESKEKAIEEYRQKRYDFGYDEWWNWMHEDFKERLKEIGIECEDFCWDLDRGRYIKMNNAIIIDKTKFLKSAGKTKELMMLSLNDNMNKVDWAMGISEPRENINQIIVEYYDYNDELEQIENIKEVFGSEDDFSEELTSYIQDILNGFLDELQEQYEYQYSDEFLEEELKINEYKFDVYGNLL